jgi:hypothetical protein
MMHQSVAKIVLGKIRGKNSLKIEKKISKRGEFVIFGERGN